MQLSRAFLLIVALVLSCRERNPPSPAIVQSSTPAPATVSAPASKSAAPGVPAAQYTTSAALFQDDQLIGCVDAIVAHDGLADLAAKASRTPQQLVDEDLKAYLSGGKSLVGRLLTESLSASATALRPPGQPEAIPKPCGEQFADRLAISSCVIGAGKGARVGFDFRSFDAIATNDRAMRACLAARGTWTEEPRDSLEFMRAKHQQQLRALQQK